MTQPRVRLAPQARREQLLDLGVRLLADHPLDEVTVEVVSERAGISRGLLYHYFGSKQAFHVAVVRRAADELVAVTDPGSHDDATTRLRRSLGAYLDYVQDNLPGYRSLLRAAAGSAELRAVYEEFRDVLGARVFADEGSLAQLGIRDDALGRLVVRGWQAMTEEVVLAWVEEPAGVSRDAVVDRLTRALPAMG